MTDEPSPMARRIAEREAAKAKQPTPITDDIKVRLRLRIEEDVALEEMLRSEGDDAHADRIGRRIAQAVQLLTDLDIDPYGLKRWPIPEPTKET